MEKGGSAARVGHGAGTAPPANRRGPRYPAAGPTRPTDRRAECLTRSGRGSASTTTGRRVADARPAGGRRARRTGLPVSTVPADGPMIRLRATGATREPLCQDEGGAEEENTKQKSQAILRERPCSHVAARSGRVWSEVPSPLTGSLPPPPRCILPDARSGDLSDHQRRLPICDSS